MSQTIKISILLLPIIRVISCRGPASSSEKARYFDVLGKKARDAVMHCESRLKAAHDMLKTKDFLLEGVSTSALAADGPEAGKETSTEESVEDSNEESGEVSGTGDERSIPRSL